MQVADNSDGCVTSQQFCSDTCFTYQGQSGPVFTVATGDMDCTSATAKIAGSEMFDFCSLSLVDIKTATGKCELIRNADQTWSAQTSGSCADQACSFTCLANNMLNATLTFGTKINAPSGEDIPNSLQFDMCLLAKATDDPSNFNSKCAILQGGSVASNVAWRIVAGPTNSCSYVCVAYDQLPTGAPTPSPTSAPTPAPTPAPPTPSTTSGTSVSTSSATADTSSAAVSTSTSTTATPTTAAATSAPSTTAPLSQSAGNSTLSNSTSTSAAPANAEDLSNVVLVPASGTVDGDESARVASGAVTVRVQDYSDVVAIELTGSGAIGADVTLDVRTVDGFDFCDLEDRQALLEVQSENGYDVARVCCCACVLLRGCSPPMNAV